MWHSLLPDRRLGQASGWEKSILKHAAVRSALASDETAPKPTIANVRFCDRTEQCIEHCEKTQTGKKNQE